MTTDNPPRFTAVEIHDIALLITERHDLGLWSRPTRQTGRDFDRVLVYLSGSRNHYRLEKDINNLVHLLWVTPHEFRLAVSGTVQECLQIFRRL